MEKAAEVLDASGRADDEHLWSVVSELSRQLAIADPDGEIFTWLIRNRRPVSNAAANVEATKATAEREAVDKGQQPSISVRKHNHDNAADALVERTPALETNL